MNLNQELLKSIGAEPTELRPKLDNAKMRDNWIEPNQ